MNKRKGYISKPGICPVCREPIEYDEKQDADYTATGFAYYFICNNCGTYGLEFTDEVYGGKEFTTPKGKTISFRRRNEDD